MAYKIRFNKGRKTFDSKKTYQKKITAQKEVKFIRQLDNDLPKSRRDKSLKTYRVVKSIPKRKIKK